MNSPSNSMEHGAAGSGDLVVILSLCFLFGLGLAVLRGDGGEEGKRRQGVEETRSQRTGVSAPLLEFYQVGESRLLVLRGEEPLPDAELDRLRETLNSNPLIKHELAK